jgi:hypothetical protein
MLLMQAATRGQFVGRTDTAGFRVGLLAATAETASCAGLTCPLGSSDCLEHVATRKAEGSTVTRIRCDAREAKLLSS